MTKEFQRSSNHIFHLAIPTFSIEKAINFYENILNFKIGRIYSDRVTFNVLDDQLVCHLVDKSEIEKNINFYPRHFGFTFLKKDEFFSIYDSLSKSNDHIFSPLKERWKGAKEEHNYFILKDPSSNFVEFKYYKNFSCIY